MHGFGTFKVILGATVAVVGEKGLIKGQLLEEVTLFIHTKVGQHCFVLCLAQAF